MSFDAAQLREAFTRFFVERGHVALPAAGLIPHDPSVLFTIAGMVQFKPYFTGEQTPPVPRATTVQPSFRMVDIDIIGTTARHATFFEMLGNFSFGDYFKETAIPLAWEFVTGVLGLDPARLWITVHESDTDAGGIWHDSVGVPAERIQKMGEDNFWKMGDTGPCGPSSEIYYDRGPEFGAEGGPAHGGEDRYVEIWNLVFMQYERHTDGTLTELPRKNIDTGAGLERIAMLTEGVANVFETSLVAPILEVAASRTGIVPGTSESGDVALRILADHARAMTMLISDGVFPTNDGRGYVLRRVIRRAVLRAVQAGVTSLITPELCAAVIDVLGGAYPKLVRDRSLVETVVTHEEEAFRRTLRAGTTLFEEALAAGGAITGEVAFRLHDTYGFPIDLTTEMASAAGAAVDREGFESQMDAQRARARGSARTTGGDGGLAEAARAVLEEFGPSEFVGYQLEAAEARVLAVHHREGGADFVNEDGESLPQGSVLVDVFLDRTPFYAEGGGQVGDTGRISGATGVFRVLDTRVATEGLSRHTGYFESGSLEPGAEVYAEIDSARRQAIRRNHTATHLLHAALRKVLGEHVQQQGSLVAPDRLRFDFSHFSALTRDELEEITALVNAEVLADEPVRNYETSRAAAEESGAMAFFGDKYGEIVRVVEAGGASVELCGGTHVGATGMIGPIRIVSEASIGANTRRIEATTGARSLAEIQRVEHLLEEIAETLRTTTAELPEAVARLLERQGSLEDELRRLRGAKVRDEAAELGASAVDGVVVARRDGIDPAALRELALAVREQPGVEAVGMIGAPEQNKVALVVATIPGAGLDARPIAGEVARLVGGGGGGSPELATAGGRDTAGIDGALERLGVLLRKG